MSHLCQYKTEKSDEEFENGIETSAAKASDYIGDSVAQILRGEFPNAITDKQLQQLCFITNADIEVCDDIRAFREQLLCRFDRLEISKL